METIDAERDIAWMDARDLLRVVRTYWKSIALVTLLCTLLSLGWSLLQPTVYTSTATGLVVTSGERDLPSALVGEDLAQSKANSYESLAESRPVTETVINELGLDATPESLLQRITTDVPVDTAEIRITAAAETPGEAAELANTWVGALASQVEALEAASDNVEAVHRVFVQPLSNAPLPVDPSSPNLQLNLVIGMIAGLALGLFYAFVRYKMDRRIRSVGEIQGDFGLEVLGVIPKDDRLEEHPANIKPQFLDDYGHHQFSESFRELRTNLISASVERAPRVIVVTSPLYGEGKSWITANLAMAFASAGRHVVVVDGDLRRPRIDSMFHLDSTAGVIDVLTGKADVENLLQPYDEYPHLRILGSGRIGRIERNSTEALSSPAMRNLLQQLAEDSIVLVDAPPLLEVTDASLLTASADGALIVATAEGTTKDELAKALENLRQARGNVLGVVLNRVPTTGLNAAYYGYYNRTYHPKDANIETSA